MIIRLLSALLAILVLASCSTASPEPTAQPSAPPVSPAETPGAYPPPVANNGYPAPGAVAGYPAPEVGGLPTLDPIVVPIPASSSVGVVHGTLLSLVDGSGVPQEALGVYLGQIVFSEGEETFSAAQFDVNSPRARYDREGGFVFTDVAPGLYALMLNTPQGPVVLNNPQTGLAITADVKGGDVIDLGSFTLNLDGLF